MPTRIRRGQTLEQVHAACCCSSSSSSNTAFSEPQGLSSINSAFQVQEYISLLVHSNPHDVARIVAVPTSPAPGSEVFSDPAKGKGRDGEGESGAAGGGGVGSGFSHPNVDTDVWVYEQLRRIVQDLTTPWLTTLLTACTRTSNPDTCSAMNAGDWLYVCASHGEDRQCCAIDYIIHTVDGTSALLNNPRHFPGRTYIPNASLRQFGSIARRLSRIFVHAYGHHRDVFEECEAQTSLYARFYALNAVYELISTESLPALDADAAKRAGLTPEGEPLSLAGRDGAENDGQGDEYDGFVGRGPLPGIGKKELQLHGD
ncbi:unnamed protein product [Tilletia controversa]|uniref:MOB-like protein phocein n=3 Tax=Tilletia TaxID=13289 RepID=A0A8X7MQ13_9BASI|nr:hypothetical protein CF336_g5582 [Tilletia laevis]KAE8192760.1 hypothetical protein CF328_g5261 [Tilletia controversa]KAE8253611.1 hypothetical protein A4X03_0g5849 [Tilletia caries]KAE8195708.1 hypothetical protein CF335_g5033 [Tilletia laevis]KAE8243589.1 hypothetical protein A4X06_0g6214 [Tilletia controversa]